MKQKGFVFEEREIERERERERGYDNERERTERDRDRERDIYIYIYIDNCKWLCYPNVGRIWCKDHVRFIGRCSSSRIDYMVKEREEYNTKPTPHAWLVVHIY